MMKLNSAPGKRSSRHIFLSFKTEEREHAFRLKSALNAEGFDVWWQEEVQCGQEWHGEIDQAVAQAGCIVVLWSKRSMISPWVRHEASQGVVKGIYTPARIEVMEIDSPYDRVQATDLINWAGETNHPGFQNLLDRIKRLLPPPTPLWQKIRNVLWTNRGAVLAIAVASGAVILLFRQSSVMNSQLVQQRQIASDIQRSLHPIENLRVSAFVDIDSSTPGFDQYLARLSEKLLVRSNGTLRARRDLPEGIYASRSDRDGPEVLSIPPSSDLWPSESDTSWLFYVVQYVQLTLTFNRLENKEEESTQPDLVIEAGSWGGYDSDGMANSHSLEWNIKKGTLRVYFSDTPLPKYWKSNGRIVSVPDLEQSSITIDFLSEMVPSLGGKKSDLEVSKSRSGLKLTYFSIEFSGQKLHLSDAKMKNTVTEEGLNRYFSLMEKDAPNP